MRRSSLTNSPSPRKPQWFLQRLLLLGAGVTLAGCGQGADAPAEAPQQATAEPSPSASAGAKAGPSSPVEVEAPAQPFEPGASTGPTGSPRSTRRSESPRDVVSLQRAKAKPGELRAWLDPTADTPPEVMVACLGKLATEDPEAALEAASGLAKDPNANGLVRANAVGLLARSQDPRADEAIRGLPPKYQRLAKTLRQQDR